MYSKEDCRKYIEQLNNEYRNKHLQSGERDELIAENNIEKRDIKGYHGREILELLQNADDAYQKSINLGVKPSLKLDVNITYINNILTISNTGTYFDKNGIKAIIQGNNSDKKGKYIGSKGTGFRSILNWAKEIRIYSDNFKLRFSYDFTNKLFEDIKNEPQIQKQLKQENNLHIPILSYPEFIEDDNNYLETIIQVYIDDQKIKDDPDHNVYSQLKNIDSKILLFLPNTNSININIEGYCVKYERDKINNINKKNQNINNFSVSDITIKKIVNSEIQQSEDYELFERCIKDKFEEDDVKKDVDLAIAIPKFSNKDNLNLYTFFPLLETSSPFNCIMHATYELGDQRNTIVSNSNNKDIIKEQLNFLFDIIENYYIKNKIYDKALNIITPTNLGNFSYNFKFQPGFQNFNVEDYYIEKLKSCKMLLTVNGNLISFNDNPLIIKNDFPNFIKGDNFNNLLEFSTYKQSEKLLTLMNKSFQLSEIKEKDLCDKISQLSENSLNTTERVVCFDWWEQHYNDYLPKLLIDQNNNWITKNSECYFLDGNFDNIKIPNWIKIPSIDEDYQNELFNVVNKNPKYIEARNNDKTTTQSSRIISNYNIYKSVNFRYRDKNSIVTALNSSVDSFDKAVDFVKWLWITFKDAENWTPPNIQDVNYNFPTAEGQVKNSKQIYLGEEYNNKLSKILFDNNYYKGFPSAEVFNIEENKVSHFKKFISKFGVMTFPKIAVYAVNIDEKFSNKLKTIFSIFKAKEIIFQTKYIKNFNEIIKRLSTQEIIQWIHDDRELFNFLQQKTLSPSEFKLSYTNRLNNTYNAYIHNNIENYLLYYLNTNKWITINNNSYAPEEVIFELNTKSNQKFSEFVPIISNEYINNLSNEINISKENIIEIFDLFKFCKNVTDLSSDKFYEIMLQIPNCKKELSIAMSEQIYRTIERKDFSKTYENSVNKNKFFEQGKLLTQKNEFVLASEIYLPSTLIVQKNKVNILKKGSRTNNDKFVTIFGCKTYKKEYTIENNSIVKSNIDSIFQEDWAEFKKYAKPYNDVNQNIRDHLDNLSITIVNKIATKSESVIEETQESYIEIRESLTKWYITLFEDEYNKNEISTCIENILTNIANTPGFDAGKFGELFRANIEGKKFLLKKDFYDYKFVDDDNVSNYLEEDFKNAINKIDPDYIINKTIDFNNINSFDSIKNILEILQDLKISDINILYNGGFNHKLDLKKYYQQEIDYIVGQCDIEYKNYLFTKAMNDISLQSNFLNNWYKFKNYKIPFDIENIIDIKKYLYNTFGNWKEFSLSDANKNYQTNYKTLNPQNLFSEDISNNDKIKQYIYFNNKTEFKNWLQDKLNNQKEENEKNNNINKFANVIPIKKEIIYSQNTKQPKNANNVIKKDRSFSSKKENQKRKNQKILGNNGELLIYNYLCKEYGKENVTPISEAFVTLGILSSGLEKSGDCDIAYFDKNLNKRFFVEVKAGDSNSFYITPEELDFAKKHSTNYKLCIVYNLGNETPDFIELPLEFWNNKEFKQEPIIENIFITF